MLNKFIKYALLAAGLLQIFSAYCSETKKESKEFQISKHLDIFNALLREVDYFYVDSIKINQTVKRGIDAMLESLDPYTNYIPEVSVKDFDFVRTGEYAGVGAIVSQRDKKVIISSLYKDKPADKAGLMPGDIFIEIDGKKVDSCSTTDISTMLRGEANTKVSVVVERPYSKKPVKTEITREKITIDPVEYADLIDAETGYISISSFTENTASHFKEQFLRMRKTGMKYLIIDLRENPGGLLDEALKIINFFVPKNSTILSTKGKVSQWEETYKTTLEPIDTTMPIAVLLNGNSASASEVVAGALQDLDRAVIIGQKSFGKGLVQTTRDIPYGGKLKVTISKYYTPSGRCVQAIDYSNKKGSSKRIPDSLTTEFKTVNGRIVRDGGGITPDSIIPVADVSTTEKELLIQHIIFDYSLLYRNKHKTIAPAKDFVFTDFEEFKDFTLKKDFNYKVLSESGIDILKDLAKQDGLYENSKEEFDALEKKLKTREIEKELDTHKEQITKLISRQILSLYYYDKGSIEYLVKDDRYANAAKEILKNKKHYDRILNNAKQ